MGFGTDKTVQKKLTQFCIESRFFHMIKDLSSTVKDDIVIKPNQTKQNR